MNAVTSRLCTEQGNQCGDSGTYSANDSSTYQFVNNAFNISYVDGSGAAGDYATDTFHFGGQTIKDMQFGIGYTSSSPEGILGIGYMVNEVQVNRFNLDEYPNLPQKLKNDGTISSNAYSLWLNDLDASTGLGLSIVRTLVESELGGQIVMRSASGRSDRPGTEVRVVVPTGAF